MTQVWQRRVTIAVIGVVFFCFVYLMIAIVGSIIFGGGGPS